jgi:hypothetical protein
MQQSAPLNIMKCQACDHLLSDREATRKCHTTKEYLDMCDRCTALSLFGDWEDNIVHSDDEPVVQIGEVPLFDRINYNQGVFDNE